MPRRVELPNGAWADIHLGDEISERKSRLIDEARMRMFKASDIDFSEVDIDASDEVNTEKLKRKMDAAQAAASMQFMPDVKDATILAFVIAWSFKGKPNNEALLDLPRKTYDVLYEACKSETIHVDTSPEGAADPKALTGDSGE